VIAALGSYLEARSRGGQWLIRIEDLDQDRMQPGAADSILQDLERLGLEWDNEPVYQSRRFESYQQALQRLQDAGHTFDCGCSRRETRGLYPGTCRYGLANGRRARSIRLRVPERYVEFTDCLHGPQSVDLARQVGDFVIRRADHIIAYHLAVVVDDADNNITGIVRGADLLDSTAPQILLQQLLNYSTPAYMHLPVVLGADSRKISKQNHAPAIADQPPAQVLWQALDFLGQDPEPQLARATAQDILAWAVRHWDITKIPLTNR